MKPVFFIIIVLSIVSFACGGSTTLEMTPEAYFNEYGGSLEVYQNIFSLTDCTELQNQFDRAADNNEIEEPGTPAHKWTLGYMKAADERMKEIGCYK